MDCINSFRIFFLRKKPFNLIWKKITAFEVLCIEFIKEIFVRVSAIFCVGKAFIMEDTNVAFVEVTAHIIGCYLCLKIGNQQSIKENQLVRY